MKLKLKSQVTMLMIVGLALFIIVSLVLYLSKSAIKKQSQQNIKIIQETAIDTQPIKEFISKCLEKLAKDSIVLLSKQGGYIYASQGGTLVDYSDTDEGLFFVKYNNFNVPYNILPPKFSIFSFSSDIPDYPWQTFPYATANSNAEIFDGFFGISNIPSLNSSEGPNSIQTQIESFIDNNIGSCTNFNIFEKQGYDITMNPPKTSVIIGSGDVSVKSTIPITVTNPATKESASLNDFSTNVNLRLRDIYFFTKKLIENDIDNIKFNISDIKNEKDSINIKSIKDVFSNDDLIIITDEKSSIYGKPYEFVFARRNRAPALYYIKPNTLSFPAGYFLNQTDLSRKPLRAEDPDEDDFTFNIFIGESGSTLAQFPKKLNVPQIKFRVEVSDGKLSDYQIITVNRI